MSSVIAAGFGANDEGVEREVLRRLLGERPVHARALLAEGGDVGRLAALAALSDSLDYVADVIHRCTGSGGGPSGGRGGGGGAPLPPRAERHSTDGSGSGGGSGAATPLAGEASGAGVAGSGGSGSGATWQQQLGSRFRTWRRTGGGEAGGLTEGLSHLADRHRALAGQCARALRLDLLLLVLHHLQQLPASSYVCESEEEAREVDECVAALNRCVWRLSAVGAGRQACVGTCGQLTCRAKSSANRLSLPSSNRIPHTRPHARTRAAWWPAWTRGSSRTCRPTSAPTPLPAWPPPPRASPPGCCPTSRP